MYKKKVKMTADKVPNGIDFDGRFRSPEQLTPDKIPVQQGKAIANI